MKNIKEYTQEQLHGQVNEFLVMGTVLASIALGHALANSHAGPIIGGVFAGFTGLFGGGLGKSAEDKRKEEIDSLEHQIKMKKLQQELDDLNKKAEKGEAVNKKEIEDKQKEIETATKQQKEKNGIDIEKSLAIATKELDNIQDPVKKNQLSKQLDIVRCMNYNEKGEKRSAEDAGKWLQENIDKDDLEAISKDIKSSMGDVEDKSVVEKFNGAVNNLTPEEITNSSDAAKKTSAELVVKFEADAKKRKEIQAKIDATNAEINDENKKKEFADKIAAAGNDEAKVKEIKTEEAKYSYECKMKLLEAQKELNDFKSNCQTSETLNMCDPNRKERCEKASKAIEENIAKAKEDHNKAMEEISGKKPEKQETPAKQEKPEEGDDKGVMSNKDDIEDEKNDNEDDADVEEIDKNASPLEKLKGKDKITHKNPAKEWHKKKSKSTGKTTKNYYNSNGDSISPEEYQQKIKTFKEKQANTNSGKNESITFKHFKDLLLEKLGI